MQLSHNGVLFLKDSEGFRDKAYRDSAGVWTIGFGTTRIDGKPVEEGMTCTPAQAEIYLQSDTAAAQTAVNQLVKVALRQNQFDALVSFVYNIGVEAFRTSTMLKLINTGSSLASAEFDKWVRAGGRVVAGLVSRRRRERSLYEAR